MIEEIQKLIDRYHAWLKDKTVLRRVNDRYVEITTPYLDRHNDYIQLYVRRENNRFVLTDDSHTIEDLRNSGVELSSPKRESLLTITLNGFGVKREGDALVVIASPETFALRKHNLIQAILAVNDLFYLAAPTVRSLFMEDVESWLELHQIRYTPRVKLPGKSGYDYLFDFVIPKSTARPERILKAVNNPNRDTASGLILAWLETRESRSPDSRFYAILNDSDRVPSESVMGALMAYDILSVLWSKREEMVEEFVA